jgi:hypothetical protein
MSEREQNLRELGTYSKDQLVTIAADLIDRLRRLENDSYWLQFTWLDEFCSMDEQERQMPDHNCEFGTNPLKGACDFHEEWFGVAERNGMMEMLAEQNMERAEQVGEVGH